MNKILQKPIISLSILVVVCAYLFFFQSGKLALTDPDETFYAQTAREMVTRGEWVTPYLYDKPQFEKPILFYWLVKISYKIFGVNAFAARFPSALFGTIGIIALYLLGTLLFNRRAGFLSAIILATSVEYIILARACVTDMVLATLMLLGVLFFYYGYIRQKSYFYLLSSAAFAMATLAKGPIAILLFGAVLIMYLLLTRDTKVFKKLPVVPMIIIFVAIAAPWYALVYKLHGKAFIDAFFGFHNITRFLQAEHKIGSQYYYNIPILFGGLFPWSAFLPAGLWMIGKKLFSKGMGIEERRRVIFILVWFFLIFMFFTASSTKLPTYIFPSFMSVALIIGLLWDDFLTACSVGAANGVVKWVKTSYYLLLAIIVVGAVVAPIVILKEYPPMLIGSVVSAVFLVFGFILATVAFARKHYPMAFLLIAYAVMLFLYPLSQLAIPALEPYETSKEVSEKLLSLMAPDERLASESNYLAGLAFYTGKIPVDIDKYDDTVKFLNSNDRIWVVMKEKNHRQLYDATINPFYVKPSYMLYRLDKRAIVTNDMPHNGVYMLRRERNP